MRLTEVSFDGRRPVDGYGKGFFRIGGQVLCGACLVLPSGVGPWGGYDDLAALTAAEIDLLFLGTGAAMVAPPAAFRAAIEARGAGVEFMASPVACRGYNVLLAEGRRIGLAVFPV